MVSGANIQTFKMCLNQNQENINVLWEVNKSINKDVWYRIWFDNDEDKELEDDPGDIQLDFKYNKDEKQWIMEAQGMDKDNPWIKKVPGQIEVNGGYN